MQTPLKRIAAALERMSPPPMPEADPTDGDAFTWAGNRLAPVRAFRPLPLAQLVGIDGQKEALLENSRRHAAGLVAHDVLLWGARGMGKSALVKAAVAEHGLPIVEVANDAVLSLPRLFDWLSVLPRRYVIFIDDLGFEAEDSAYKALRSLLEGGVSARPDNCRLYVTSNRRNLTQRIMAENDPINPRDVMDDRLALADRFGLSLGFHACDQATYLAIAANYARLLDLPFDRVDALSWAITRGARSGRVAWQYAQELAGRSGIPAARSASA